MSDSFTPLGFTKPEVGASSNTWGGKLNADFDLVDTLLQRTVGTTTTALLSFNVTGVSTTTTRSVIWRDTSGAVAMEALLRSYLAGLTLSNDAITPNTKIDVAAGVAMDDGNTTMLTLASSIINCGTTGANGLDTGSLGASTVYHAYVIGTPGAVTTAALASTNATSPSLPGSYTLKRRIGSFITDGSSHILAFVQSGDEFLWSASVVDQNSATVGSVAGTVTLTVPTGVKVWAKFRALMTAQAATTSGILYYPLDQATQVASVGNFSGAWSGNGQQGGDFQIRTNTSAQIGIVAATAGNVTSSISTYGWIDRRGRDA